MVKDDANDHRTADRTRPLAPCLQLAKKRQWVAKIIAYVNVHFQKLISLPDLAGRTVGATIINYRDAISVKHLKNYDAFHCARRDGDLEMAA